MPVVGGISPFLIVADLDAALSFFAGVAVGFGSGRDEARLGPVAGWRRLPRCQPSAVWGNKL
jgi:hypothetical protein